jgi:ATP-dependent RNA helicase RhlE
MVATNPGNMLVFARTKHRTDRVMRSLCDAGHAAQRLHSNRSQVQRREALEGFRRGRYRILVATDIAARGIDVADIKHVINYDLPQTVEDYVHRVGRTARASAEGRATSFAAPEERGQLHAIERHIGRALPRQTAQRGAHAPRPSEPTMKPAPAPSSHHRSPRPVEAKTHRHRPVRPSSEIGLPSTGPRSRTTPRHTGPLSLADLGGPTVPVEQRRRRPSAQARRARRGRHA